LVCTHCVLRYSETYCGLIVTPVFFDPAARGSRRRRNFQSDEENQATNLHNRGQKAFQVSDSKPITYM
jgi:hypothetical protein